MLLNKKIKIPETDVVFTDDDYIIPKLNPRKFVMTNELQRRKEEESLRKQYGVKKVKFGAIL